MWFIILGFIVVIILCIAAGVKNDKYGTGNNVKVQFINSDSGKTVHTGHGNSIGSAILDGFYKMWYSVSISSHEDTIRSKYNSMVQTLSENRNRMRNPDIISCEEYISKMRALLQQKEREREEKERYKAFQLQQKERERKEKERYKTSQQKFVAEQRRLMSDSLRYDVLRRDGFRCQICGATAADGVKLHVDHVFPVSKGGKTEMSNLRTLCERCNMGKSNKIE